MTSEKEDPIGFCIDTMWDAIPTGFEKKETRIKLEDDGSTTVIFEIKKEGKKKEKTIGFTV